MVVEGFGYHGLYRLCGTGFVHINVYTFIDCVHQSCSYCKCCFAINGGIIWLAGCQPMLCGMP